VIHRDAQFLAENNLMDYSLLLIKARNPDFNKSSNDSKEEHKLLRMPAIVYVRQKQGPNMLVLRETDNLNIDFRKFGRVTGKPLTNTQRIETDERIPDKMEKKCESNLDPKTKKLKEGEGGSSSGGAVANSGQLSNQHEESKGILITESDLTQSPKRIL
jgi:hypothetical protein